MVRVWTVEVPRVGGIFIYKGSGVTWQENSSTQKHVFHSIRIQRKIISWYTQVSLAVRGGYVPENCREWQNRER